MQRAAAEAIGTFALVGAGSASLLVRAIFGAHTNLGATLPATGV